MMKYPIPVITFLPPCLSFYHHLLLVFFVFPLPANKISEEGSRVDGGGGKRENSFIIQSGECDRMTGRRIKEDGIF